MYLSLRMVVNHGKPLNDLMPNINVNTLAQDPNNNNIIYAGTGEMGEVSRVLVFLRQKMQELIGHN